MESKIDRIEITDQVVFDAWHMTFPEFVAYYRDINGFALRSQGGTHNIDEVYHQIIQDLLDKKRKLNSSLKASSRSKWLQAKKKKPATRPYADLIVPATTEEEYAHNRDFVDPKQRNSTVVSSRAARGARSRADGVIRRNQDFMSDNPTTVQTPPKKSRSRGRGAGRSTTKQLSGRKKQIYDLMQQGTTDPEVIAEQLGTNKSYVQRLIKEING